jgi:hypothetical protein
VTSAEVARHFGLVGHVIGRMLRRGALLPQLELEDVEAVGRFGLWQGLRHASPAAAGTAQTAYLATYIEGYIRHYQRQVTKALGWHRELGQVAHVDSLDAPYGDDGRTLLDFVGERAAPDGRALLVEVLRAVADLAGEERAIAEQLLADRPIADAAARAGVTPSYARKIATRVRRRVADSLAVAA